MNPKVSIIIPVRNCARQLRRCLESIARQNATFPIEILIIDGGSTDDTLIDAHGYRWAPTTVLENPRRVAEEAKLIGLRAAKGEYILFLDADNVLASDDFLTRAVELLERNPDIHGLESEYLPAQAMSSFCRYLTACLHISDPLSWKLSTRPAWAQLGGGAWHFAFARWPESLLACIFWSGEPLYNYPLGANGFVYRRSAIRGRQAFEPDGLDHPAPPRADEIYSFEDTEIARATLAANGWIRQHGLGVHHHIVEGPTIWSELLQFLQKRRRQTFHFLSRSSRSSVKSSWTSQSSKFLAILYCLSIVGPCCTAFKNLFPPSRAYYENSRPLSRHGRDWLWHPLACWLSILGAAWGVLTFYTSIINTAFNTFDREASLQP